MFPLKLIALLLIWERESTDSIRSFIGSNSEEVIDYLICHSLIRPDDNYPGDYVLTPQGYDLASALIKEFKSRTTIIPHI